MSPINKVQNQRTPKSGRNANDGISQRTHRDGSNSVGIMIGMGVFILILIGLVAGLTFILLSKGSSTPVQTEIPASETVNPPAAIVPPTGSAEAVSAKPEVAEPPSETIAKPAAEPNPEILKWLEDSLISGVRITSSSSKVILNNEAFVPGDTVNVKLGLSVLEIEEKRIILIDSNDVKYVKLL